MRHDLRGVPLSSGSPAALERYETALTQFQTYVGDPVATIDAALAESPDFVMGHLLKALALFTQAKSSSWPRPKPRSATRCATTPAPTTASAA